MDTKKLRDGVDLHIISAPKFKTNLLSVYFNIPLKRETVTYAALLPSVLKRGSVDYSTMKDMSRRLDDLYSASVSAGVRMKGDGEVLYFTAEYISDRFIGENLTSKIAEFLHSFIFSPLTEDGGFNKEYTKSEKINLRNAISGLINDKKAYAEFKCREAMFGKDGYGMFEAGYAEDLDEITPQSLYKFYCDVLKNAKIDIFISGTLDEASISETERILGSAFEPREANYIGTLIASSDDVSLKNVTEDADVVQSKLCMGMRCGTEPVGDEFYAITLASCIFGGSPFSKLFANVREKLSLAYYAVARYSRFKSVMMISSGIQTENFKAAYDEIMLQFKKMQDGEIDDFEIESAKKYLANAYNSLSDSLYGMEDYYLSQCIMGSTQSIEELLDGVLSVDKKRVCEVMKKVKPDTVYFLKGKSAGEAE